MMNMKKEVNGVSYSIDETYFMLIVRSDEMTNQNGMVIPYSEIKYFIKLITGNIVQVYLKDGNTVCIPSSYYDTLLERFCEYQTLVEENIYK